MKIARTLGKRHVRTAVGLWAAVAFCGCGPLPPAPRPSLLVITLDTVRADHLSCYGYDAIETPAIDRIASDGVRFSRAVSSSPWTLPAHASLFTGLAVSQHGARYDLRGSEGISWHRIASLGSGPRTLAEILTDAGYHTAGVGAGIWMKSEFGLGRGFEDYRADVEGFLGMEGDRVTDLAIEILDHRPQGKPFFLFLNYFDAHAPYDPPPEFHPAAVEAARNMNAVEIEVNSGAKALDPAEREQLVNLYDGELRFVDAQLGRLWSRLEAEGIYDDTWIVVTADHGESFGDHGFYGHGLVTWEDVIRVPLLIKPPRDFVQAPLPGSVVETVVQPRNLVPTVLHALQLEIPEAVGGRDLLGHKDLGEGSSVVVAEAYRSYAALKKFGLRWDHDERAIYGRGKKLILRTDGTGALYDAAQDPAETTDLADTHPRDAARLRRALDEWVMDGTRVRYRGRVAPIDKKDAERLRALGYLD